MKTKAVKKVIKKSEEEIKPNFSVILKIGTDVYNGEGETALEALQSIPRPTKISAKGTFFITDGVKKSKEVFMLPIRLKRLFYKGSQSLQLKSLCMGMK